MRSISAMCPVQCIAKKFGNVQRASTRLRAREAIRSFGRAPCNRRDPHAVNAGRNIRASTRSISRANRRIGVIRDSNGALQKLPED
jgi:hypothetical protein